jgi:hypothetical protein
MVGLSNEASNKENLADLFPAQRKSEAARQCREASSYRGLSHRRDQSGRERHIQPDEQYLDFLPTL